VYDLDAAKAEELQVVTKDPSLRGKTRKKMNLEPFRGSDRCDGYSHNHHRRSDRKGMQGRSYWQVPLECQQKSSSSGQFQICSTQRKPSNQTGGYRRPLQDASEVHDGMLLLEGRWV